MMSRRRSVGKGIISQISKLNTSMLPNNNNTDDKETKTSTNVICFLDPLCAVQKELSPWSFDPIYKRPPKGKLTSKIDDEKVCKEMWSVNIVVIIILISEILD